MEKYEDSIWVSLKKNSKNNKRGDPWSQACMKIEMLYYAAFSLQHQKFDSSFHPLFENLSLPSTLNIQCLSEFFLMNFNFFFSTPKSQKSNVWCLKVLSSSQNLKCPIPIIICRMSHYYTPKLLMIGDPVRTPSLRAWLYSSSCLCSTKFLTI